MHTVSVPPDSIPGLESAVAFMEQCSPAEQELWIEALRQVEDAEFERITSRDPDIDVEREFEGLGLPSDVLSSLDWPSLLDPSTVGQTLNLIDERWRMDVWFLLDEHVAP
ncbi:hypothetical protein [Microcella humidisoli]|uniref:PH domain-containing protein n=1 Tax=Microcella humidisoli TaxID=2963406 RepID=A0ABY5FXP1_9MICO|nr:hypothetical protein [Microcella humidisoli]UTT62526.1 hypothetical protein NNL39_12885 [Microcella humidisoli]